MTIQRSRLHDVPSTPKDWEAVLRVLCNSGPDRLTPRERSVCARRALAWTDRRIADDLVVTSSTVRGHTAHILVKLGLESVHEIPNCCLRRFFKRWRQPVRRRYRKSSTKRLGRNQRRDQARAQRLGQDLGQRKPARRDLSRQSAGAEPLPQGQEV